MAEFFRGWKPKLGVVTLLLTCAFAAGWIRSETSKDWIFLRCGDASYIEIDSSHDFLDARLLLNTPWNAPKTNWNSDPLDTSDDRSFYREPYDDERMLWRVRFAGLDLGSSDSVLPACDGMKKVFVAVPYWMFVVPLSRIPASGTEYRYNGFGSSRSSCDVSSK